MLVKRELEEAVVDRPDRGLISHEMTPANMHTVYNRPLWGLLCIVCSVVCTLYIVCSVVCVLCIVSSAMCTLRKVRSVVFTLYIL